MPLRDEVGLAGNPEAARLGMRKHGRSLVGSWHVGGRRGAGRFRLVRRLVLAERRMRSGQTHKDDNKKNQRESGCATGDLPVAVRYVFHPLPANHAPDQKPHEMKVQNGERADTPVSNRGHEALPSRGPAWSAARADSMSGSCTLTCDSNIVIEGSIHTLTSGAFWPS